MATETGSNSSSVMVMGFLLIVAVMFVIFFLWSGSGGTSPVSDSIQPAPQQNEAQGGGVNIEVPDEIDVSFPESDGE